VIEPRNIQIAGAFVFMSTGAVPERGSGVIELVEKIKNGQFNLATLLVINNRWYPSTESQPVWV
jgi:hypothetical protein